MSLSLLFSREHLLPRAMQAVGIPEGALTGALNAAITAFDAESAVDYVACMQALKAMGLIERVGSNRKGYWKFIEKAKSR